MHAVAKVEQGGLQGLQSEDGAVRKFLGVPYASPPVGELRWRPPTAPQAWSGLRSAVRPGPIAPQSQPVPSSLYYGGPALESEDCLYLNVITGPAGDRQRPVMVWLHFGAFQFGSGTNPIYLGERLARAGATVVTINYRLNRLGFLAHPALSEESAEGSSGNYGLLDQLAALEWVQRNVEAFGGDPGCVTLFGLSAGGHSVHLLRSSPLAKGLFHRAIAQSGVGFAPTIDGPGDPAGMQSLRAAEEAGLELGELLGAATAKELRALPAKQLAGAVLARSAGRWRLPFLPPEVTFGLQVFDSGYPIIDGHVLPRSPLETFEAGKQVDVPTITGSAANESSGIPFVSTLTDYLAELEAAFGQDAEQAMRLYPADSDATVAKASGDLFGERMFTWAGWKGARLQTATGSAPVFYYSFRHAPPLPPHNQIVERDNAGAFHGAEVFYLFGSFAERDWLWRDEDRLLAERISAYWVNFARTGDPNGGELPLWPRFDASEQTMVFDPDPHAVAEVPGRERLVLFDRLYERWRTQAPGRT